MADNVTLNAGTGGAVIATDDDTTAHHQYVKMEWGADGTFTKVAAGASAVPIQDGGNSITVDNGGTFATQAAQSGTWNITNVSGTVSLPTGAATAAKQPALGTAGTASADVITVQGIAAMTALKVDGSAVTQPVSGTVAVTGVATAANQTTIIGHVDGLEGLLTTIDADTSNLSTKIDTIAGAVAGTEMQVDVLTMPTITVNSHAVTNAGTFAVQAAQSGTWTVQPGNTANTTPWLVSNVGLATDGLSIFRSLDLDETEEEVKATAGVVYGCWVTNTATSTRWLKFYNATAANVTVGTTTPVITIGIPGNSSDDISGNFGPGGVGIGFGTAITVAATTGVADADTGAPAANDVIVNIFYK